MLSMSRRETTATEENKGRETFYGKRWFYTRTRASVLPFFVRMEINRCTVDYYSH